VENRAERTWAKVSLGLQDGFCAGIPELTRLIHSLSAKVTELAVEELADLIKNDTVVLERVIGAANTVVYHPSSDLIVSLNEAIQVIGFDRVRSLTMALMLLEDSHRWQLSDVRRQASLQSLTAGLMAQSWAELDRRLPPDLAFLSGALRGFGRIILATYLVEEMQEAEVLMKDWGEDAAYRKVFGLTPTEVGHRWLESTPMSPQMLRTLREWMPDRKGRTEPTRESLMQGLSDCAYRMAALALDERLEDTAFRRQAEGLMKEYAEVFPDLIKQLDQVLASTRHQVEAMVRSCGRSALSRQGLGCLVHRVERTDPGPRTARGNGDRSEGVTVGSGDEEAQQEAFWEERVRRMEEVLEGKEAACDRKGGALPFLLDSLSQGFAAAECWLFLPESGTGALRLARGLGRYVKPLEGRARIVSSGTDLFSFCLKRREGVFIHDAREGRIQSRLPLWYRGVVDLASFVLLFLPLEGGGAGVVLVGWPEATSVAVPPRQARLVRRLLEVAGRAGAGQSTSASESTRR
jgi:HD-like signal output (HDOD) protein